jgi:hypothetical protein
MHESAGSASLGVGESLIKLTHLLQMIGKLILGFSETGSANTIPRHFMDSEGDDDYHQPHTV